jgi:hypothetical protein
LAAPTGNATRFRLITAGDALLRGCAGARDARPRLYLSSFASYNETYGAFAGAVILLLWIWIAAGAVLLDAELSARRVIWIGLLHVQVLHQLELALQRRMHRHRPQTAYRVQVQRTDQTCFC